jgi:hypothetical protein
MVLRAGKSLVAAGYVADAIAIYEHFIDGLQDHALNPIQDSITGTSTDDKNKIHDLTVLARFKYLQRRFFHVC